MTLNVRANGWTGEAIAELERLWLENVLSTRQIGVALGTTHNAVIGRVNRSPHLPRKPSPIIRSDGKPRVRKIRAPAITLTPLASLAGTIHIPTRSRAPRTTPSKRPATTPEPKPEQVVRKTPQRTCEWLSGDDKRTWVRCSEPAEFGKPYCARHCAVAYIRRPPPKQEAA